ncbi:glycoside hydrolase family 55 protein [Lysobacter sp. BMK333-48F3]|uniref:glycoside hydrolase family 55 protein n=1 Tax=Lysobacter sp. BMK333-48F3 TaxID=2867962 RepID=UPI001C8B80D0|nr:glycoside hydrolase family 55 protein [Lysobacter sp. BMK333-48F3]MBX9402440.1 glycoside hydrolase family 55 protein [Lysobacter sp. BMK333-48F3]
MSKKSSGNDATPTSRSRRQLIGAAGLMAAATAGAGAAAAAAVAPTPRRTAAAVGTLALPADGRVNVKDHGALGNGSTDDTAAIERARDAVFASVNSNGWLTHHLYFPAGVYRVTKADALLPMVGPQLRNYVIEGQGKRSSEILFDAPLVSGDRFNNNLMTAAGRLRQFRVREIGFRSARAGLSWLFAWSAVNDSNQDFAFDDVEWRGPWERIIGLDGPSDSNLNSEWSFNRCHLTNDVVLSDAFLHSGMSPEFSQQDQFLNFWFRDCKFEYKSGTLLRFAKGGYINVYGGSWIHTNTDPQVPSVFFDLPAQSHSNTVKTLVVIGVRFELRSTSSKLLNCGWDAKNGSLTFISCTDAAWSHVSSVGPVSFPVTYRPRNGDMPFVKWQSCQLMGRHESYATVNRDRLLFEQCNTLNATAATFVVQR